jgi:hypothetical protein
VRTSTIRRWRDVRWEVPVVSRSAVRTSIGGQACCRRPPKEHSVALHCCYTWRALGVGSATRLRRAGGLVGDTRPRHTAVAQAQFTVSSATWLRRDALRCEPPCRGGLRWSAIDGPNCTAVRAAQSGCDA